MKKAVLWDLDGTLVDSEEYHWQAWRETMRDEGIEITHEQFVSTFGQRNDSILPKWLGESATPARVQRIGDDKEAAYRRLVRECGIAPLPGASELVGRLHSEGWLQAIASSAPRKNVDAILDALHMADAFEATVSAEDVTHGKPNPEVFLTAAAKLGVEPARAIVIEDSAVGVEAARQAGMRSIGVGRGGVFLAADVSVKSLVDLPADAFDRLLLHS